MALPEHATGGLVSSSGGDHDRQLGQGLAVSAMDVVLERLAIPKPGSARCPAHDDNRESLSVSQGNEGVVLHCHAGCGFDAIVEAMGLRKADLFDQRRPEGRQARRVVDTYPYVDEAGELLYEVVRYEPKGFGQRRPVEVRHDGTIRWDYKLGDVQRVLYRLPDVNMAASGGIPIYVVEGEKDVAAIEREGEVATCNPGGAGKWREEYTKHLLGTSVIVVADGDAAGRDHAAKVAASCRRAGIDVSVVEPAQGFKDVAEHLGAGRSFAELVPWDESRVAASALQPRLPNTWVGRELLESADGQAPWIIPGIIRSDWRVVVVAIEGHGKSVLLRTCAQLTAQGVHPFTGAPITPVRALSVDLENPKAAIRHISLDLERVLARRANYDAERWWIHTEPEGWDLRKRRYRELFEERLEKVRPGLVTIGPGYKMHGSHDTDDEALWAMFDYLQRLQVSYGFALIIEHHAPLGQVGKGRDIRPIGSSLWQRWPDMGIGLQPKEGENQWRPTKMLIKMWRGGRMPHGWPEELHHRTPTDGPGPWVGVWPSGIPNEVMGPF